jgi:hypothetical protein
LRTTTTTTPVTSLFSQGILQFVSSFIEEMDSSSPNNTPKQQLEQRPSCSRSSTSREEGYQCNKNGDTTKNGRGGGRGGGERMIVYVMDKNDDDNKKSRNVKHVSSLSSSRSWIFSKQSWRRQTTTTKHDRPRMGTTTTTRTASSSVDLQRLPSF